MTRQIRVPATYMRGGTSKGTLFCLNELPLEAQQPGEFRDVLLMRIVGSPDPYGKHIDGMGGGTSSTSKVAIVSESHRADHDVEYLFGQVAIGKQAIDWSGNCGNLSAAIGPFAIEKGLVPDSRLVDNGPVTVRVWQANIGKTINIQVPMTNGEVEESGDFYLDGVAFPAPELNVEFMSPADEGESMFPTGNTVDSLEVPNVGTFNVTMINAGIPTVFLDAEALGYKGTELQEDINQDEEALTRFETIRAHAALCMGLIDNIEQAKVRQHTPKIAFVAPSQSYQTSSGKTVSPQDCDLLVRALSMGQLHHAMMGTAAVAIACSVAVPGTVPNMAAGGGGRDGVTFGHPSGTLKVGAVAKKNDYGWVVDKAVMSRSARILMEGFVRVNKPHYKN